MTPTQFELMHRLICAEIHDILNPISIDQLKAGVKPMAAEVYDVLLRTFEPNPEDQSTMGRYISVINASTPLVL